jgi:hypothetical protein
MNQTLRIWPVFFRQTGIRKLELRAFIRFEEEQEAQVNHSSRRVETGRGRHGKELPVPVPGGEALRKQNLRERLWARFLQELCRYAMRKPLRAQLRIENLSERDDLLSIARKKVILLAAIGEDPVGTHGDHALFFRFEVSWNAE